MDIQADMPTSALKAKQLLGILSCEPPNSDLHNFIGNFAYQPRAGAPSFNAKGLMRVAASPEGGTTVHSDWTLRQPLLWGWNMLGQEAAAQPRSA